MSTLPALFVSHGAPTFATEPGRAGALLRAFAAGLSRPRAILVVSPHWMTRGVVVSASLKPATIHDFGGFAAHLYRLAYPAPGAPEWAARVAAHLAARGIAFDIDDTRGLDHGAWVPLMHLYPDADIPVFQVSLPAYRAPAQFLRFGQALAGLRDEGVLVVASGSITHNLYDYLPGAGAAAPYAGEFAEWIAARLADGDVEALLGYRARAPHAERAHPTGEHLMPLLVAMGAAGDGWKQLTRLDAGVVDGALAMDAYAFGVAAPGVDEEAREGQAVALD